MSRPKNITPSRKLTLMLPSDIMARLDLHLVSGATGRVPQGAYQRLFTQLVTEYFSGLTGKKERSNV